MVKGAAFSFIKSLAERRVLGEIFAAIVSNGIALSRLPRSSHNQWYGARSCASLLQKIKKAALHYADLGLISRR